MFAQLADIVDAARLSKPRAREYICFRGCRILVGCFSVILFDTFSCYQVFHIFPLWGIFSSLVNSPLVHERIHNHITYLHPYGGSAEVQEIFHLRASAKTKILSKTKNTKTVRDG